MKDSNKLHYSAVPTKKEVEESIKEIFEQPIKREFIIHCPSEESLKAFHKAMKEYAKSNT